MKCTIPEISWHNRDPVLSIDIQPVLNEDIYRLATGGADCHLLIWHLQVVHSCVVNVDMVSDLTRHQKAVNVVRWSPSGQVLASGDDDAFIILWTLKTDNIPLLEGESNDKEIWLVYKILKGHREDVYDISWSPNGLKLVSGSIDNTAILWDVTKGQTETIFPDHKGFVQGVAWDPKDQYIVTLSSDRVCRIFDNTGKTVKSRIHKGILPFPESHSLYNKEVKYFHNDMFKSYFRRLSFSCDGNLLFLPSGCIDVENSKTLPATYIFTLDRLTSPVAILPSPKQITIATRCCPIMFELHDDGPDPVIDLPYRMIIAVGTDRDVILYDTQQLLPVAHFNRIHYTRITDLTWSHNGQLLLVSSTDGFCTLITFEKDELGIKYNIKEESEEAVINVSSTDEQENIKSIKKPNILEQWALKAPKGMDQSEEKKATPIAVRREPKRPAVTSFEDVLKKSKLEDVNDTITNTVVNEIQESLENNSAIKEDITKDNTYAECDKKRRNENINIIDTEEDINKLNVLEQWALQIPKSVTKERERIPTCIEAPNYSDHYGSAVINEKLTCSENSSVVKDIIVDIVKDEISTEHCKEENVLNISDTKEINIETLKKSDVFEQCTVKTPSSSKEENKPSPITIRREPKRAVLTKIGDIIKKPKENDQSNSAIDNCNTMKLSEKQKSSQSSTVKDINNTPIVLQVLESTHESPLDVKIITTNSNSPEKQVVENQLSDTIILVNGDLSPVKSETSPNREPIKNFQTPTSITKNSNSNSTNNSYRKGKKETKSALLQNSPLFKFLQRSTVKPPQEKNEAATLQNEIKEATVTTKSNPFESDVIVDSNDGRMPQSKNVPAQISSDIDVISEKMNVDLQLNKAAHVPDCDNVLLNSIGNQPSTSKVLTKPPRRIQLITLSSPKRKKYD